MPTGKGRDSIDRAIERLKKSIDPGLWIDQTHLRVETGESVFDFARQAVAELRLLSLASFIERIVRSDRLLALVAIEDAQEANGNAKEIARAVDFLSRGDTALATGDVDRALARYGDAWSHAIDAIGQ